MYRIGQEEIDAVANVILNGRMFRVWMLSNNILWCTYDIVQGAYQPLLTHSILLAFYVIGIIINDRKSKSKSNL